MFGVFGFVFASIGVVTIIWLWAQPFGAFGSPPLFFRVFGSLIAIAFVAMGGGSLVGVIASPGPFGANVDPTQPLQGDPVDRPASSSGVGYTCPSCGATLSDKADVSPLGDVKCTFCDRWFNIHRT